MRELQPGDPNYKSEQWFIANAQDFMNRHRREGAGVSESDELVRRLVWAVDFLQSWIESADIPEEHTVTILDEARAYMERQQLPEYHPPAEIEFGSHYR